MKKLSSEGFRYFWPYLQAYPKELIAASLFGIANGVTVVLMTYYIGVSVDLLIGAGQVDFTGLFRILALFGGILLLTVVSQWVIQILGNRIAYRSVAELRKDTFEHLNRLPLRYYDQTAHGNIVSRFTNDMDNVSVAISAVFIQLFSGVSTLVLALAFMLYLSPLLTIVVLVATPIIFTVMWVVARASQHNFSSQQKITGELSGFINERIRNQKIVKAFQQEGASQERFEEINQRLYVDGQKAQFSSSLTNPLSRVVDHLAYISVGLVGGLLALNGNYGVTIGVISSFTIYSSQFTKPFIEISGITTQIQLAFAGLDRAYEIIQQPIEEPSEENARVLTEAKGAVSFRDVDFAYQEGQTLITDFNLEVQPGETIAIVGKTGAGKSTLINLLMRFYDVDKGSILIDGTDIRHITRDSLRQSFGMVLQETWLFEGSLRANLRYGRKDATDEEIYDALKMTYMYDYVARLPEGLNTRIGDSGIKISDGQRQLLTIARTMISEPDMLILDEATSSVDTLTEQKIQSAFLHMMEGRTSFVIAHRLSTIRNADKILVLDQGNILEIGSHDELLAQDGYYKKLYKAQFAAEE
ncbi:ABC transporter ATP-binding protein [Desemzia sp. RIT804]|uniref:ABC transporter ATP-binding protein n=1 Tax=Desemzia sp. RIT 804 TaxID=2810209 RepID=UPI00194EB689|nr:ABC transporter ATP-binding protein [Desemzia sp. RIT 804]MBM6615354.1 ABC transporter ATP-binding protein [Desemzia sp. RIT 804]